MKDPANFFARLASAIRKEEKKPMFKCAFCQDTLYVYDKMPQEWSRVRTACPKCCREDYQAHLKLRLDQTNEKTKLHPHW